MPRYELSEGTSNKFWEITLDGASFTTAWGRIGTAGQSATKQFDTPAKAQLEHDKLVTEKVKKGYLLVASATTPAPTAPPAAKPTPAAPAAKAAPAPTPSPPPAPTPTPTPAPAPAPTPPLSPSPSPSPSPSTSTSTLDWTDDLSRRARTERERMTVDPTPRREPGPAFAALYNAFVRGPKGFVEQGLARATEHHEPVRRLMRIYGSPTPPATFDAEAEGMALVLLPRVFPAYTFRSGESAAALIVRSWVERHGVVAAVEAYAASLGPYGVEGFYGKPPAFWLVTDPRRPLADAIVGPVDGHVRAHLLAADPAAQAAAKERATLLRKHATLRVRAGLSAVFVDADWVARDVAERLAAPEPWVFNAPMLLALAPGELARLLAALTVDEATFLVPGPSAHVDRFAHALLERHREAALAPLAEGIARVAALVDLQSHCQSLLPLARELLDVARCARGAPAIAQAAVAVLARLGGEKLGKDEDPRPLAIECLTRSAHAALPLVRAAAQGKAGGWARELVPRLERLVGAVARPDEATPDELPPPLTHASPFKAPSFWAPESFQWPLVRSGRALPRAALDALGALLAAPTPDEGALAQVKDACTPASLAAFTWDLFQAWMTAGSPSKERWAFLALGRFGDDDVARRLTPLIRAWPGESAHQRAVLGLDVLAGIGSDVAMMMLNGIAQKVKFKALQERARGVMDEIAERRGLSAEELADRLVPDLDLDDDGSKILDFGPRSFRVGFDETLSPFVSDASGARLKDLPKPNAKDDPALAAAAVEAWKVMKKDARTIAGIELLRLELAMGNARRWSGHDLRTFLVGHPLLGHLARRLVWGVFAADGALAATFRVAEDGSYADAADEALTVADDARVGVAHRLQLSDTEAQAWTRVFNDYGLAQPFVQLDRSVYRLAPGELVGTRLARFEGRQVDTKKVMGLLGRGWRKGSAHDNGLVPYFYKPIGRDVNAGLQLSGINVSSMDYTDPIQELGFVDFGSGEPRWSSVRPHAIPLADIPPVVMSEVVRDIEALLVEAAP